MQWHPKVYVVSRPDRKFYYFKYLDEEGRTKFVSAKTTRRNDAERSVEKFVARLLLERTEKILGWPAFRKRYEKERLIAKSQKHQDQFRTAISQFETIADPLLVSDIDAAMIAKFVGKLRAKELTESSIAAYLRQLKAALRWAVKVGLIEKCPHIDMPAMKIDEGVKGRPITEAEFQKMLSKLPKVVGPDHHKEWKFLLRGLFLSGLRIQEAMLVSWDDTSTYHICNLDGDSPYWRIPPGLDKSKYGRSIALTPDFVSHLQTVPPHQRTGRVFHPAKKDGSRHHRADTVAKRIAKLGDLAHVIVDSSKTPPKFASAHDLRRSFAERWKTLPHTTLMTIMRHGDIKTTLKYYAGRRVEQDSAILREVFNSNLGATLGATHKKTEAKPR